MENNWKIIYQQYNKFWRAKLDVRMFEKLKHLKNSMNSDQISEIGLIKLLMTWRISKYKLWNIYYFQAPKI